MVNIRTQLWLFLLFRFVPVFATDFEKTTSYFSTSNPAFSQDYIHRIKLTFFKSNWLHSTLLQLFQPTLKIRETEQSEVMIFSPQ